MSIEISNAIHAMAVIARNNNGDPIFVGQGNVGFAPFGNGPNFSEGLGVGRYRLHMLAPISIISPNAASGRGEGMIIAEPISPAQQPEFSFSPLAAPPSKAVVSVIGVSDIFVQTLTATGVAFAGATNFTQAFEDLEILPGAFTDLLTVPILFAPDGSGTLDVLATASAQASLPGSRVEFQLTLDGNLLGPGAANGASFTVDSDGGKGTIAIAKRVLGVSSGSHTVKLRWRVVGVESSAAIRVSSGNEHASLRVSEESIVQGDNDDNVPFQVLVVRFPQQSTVS
jgi:hypothetical protein